MNATATTYPAGGAIGRLPGFGGLLRKELTDWLRGKRAWVVLLVGGSFMALSALNSWLVSNLTPPGGLEGAPPPILDPMLNLAVAISSQIFVVAAIFATMGSIVQERESGTLAWTASKPVSRTAIWLSKVVASTAVLWIVAGLAPLAVTALVVVALYGPVAPGAVLLMGLGMGMSIALFVVVAMAASTVVPSQAAVAAIAIAVLFLPQLLGLVVPAQLLPTSILDWTMQLAAGGSPGFATPVSWAITLVVLGLLATRRMERLEL